MVEESRAPGSRQPLVTVHVSLSQRFCESCPPNITAVWCAGILRCGLLTSTAYSHEFE